MGEHDAEIGRQMDTAHDAADAVAVALSNVDDLLFEASLNDAEARKVRARVQEVQDQAKMLLTAIRTLTRELQPHREGGA